MEWLIPVIDIGAPVLIVALALLFAYQKQRLEHVERMAMIEKGLLPAEMKETAAMSVLAPERPLHSGVVTSLIGLALLVGLGSLGYGPWLRGGLIPLAVGIGRIISYLVHRVSEEGKADDHT